MQIYVTLRYRSGLFNEKCTDIEKRIWAPDIPIENFAQRLVGTSKGTMLYLYF